MHLLAFIDILLKSMIYNSFISFDQQFPVFYVSTCKQLPTLIWFVKMEQRDLFLAVRFIRIMLLNRNVVCWNYSFEVAFYI